MLTVLVSLVPPLIGLFFFASYSSPLVSSRSDIAPFSMRLSSSVPDIWMPLEKADARETTEGGGRVALVAREAFERLLVREGVEFVRSLDGLVPLGILAVQLWTSLVPLNSGLRY